MGYFFGSALGLITGTLYITLGLAVQAVSVTLELVEGG